jgi:hypothetical protein
MLNKLGTLKKLEGKVVSKTHQKFTMIGTMIVATCVAISYTNINSLVAVNEFL